MDRAAAPGLDWSDDLDGVDWEELSRLYVRAPLGLKPPEHLRVSFGNSRFRCFVRDKGQLVGVGRALADGVDCAYIGDVAVLPEYQGCGLGKAIMARLLELTAGHRKVILYAAPGKEAFYLKLGFRPMNTAMAIFANEANALATGLVREA